MLHLSFPNIFEYKGGIQVYSAFLLRAFQELFPNENLELFLKHDTKGYSKYQNTKLHFSGKVPPQLRTLFFASQIFSYGLLQKPKLIISSHLNFSLAGYWLNQLTSIPYWTVAHGIEAWNIEKPSLKRALSNADKILAVSNYTKNRLIQEQNINSEKIFILPNTFEPSRFKIAPKPDYLLKRYNLSAEQPIIFTVARLDIKERFKGYDSVLKTIPLIKKSLPEIHYILGGKGADKERILKMIQELNITENVTLTGFIADEELADHYNLCDLFILPSKTEGFGIVYLEALASGKPCIGGNQDGATDALAQGELGILVNPDNLEQIADESLKILGNKSSNLLLFQPELLRIKVIEKFGFNQFKETLKKILLQNSDFRSFAE